MQFLSSLFGHGNGKKMRTDSKPPAEKLLMTEILMAVAPCRLASLVLLSNPLSTLHYFLFRQANLQLNIGHDVNFVFLASTSPKASATPNNA